MDIVTPESVEDEDVWLDKFVNQTTKHNIRLQTQDVRSLMGPLHRHVLHLYLKRRQEMFFSLIEIHWNMLVCELFDCWQTICLVFGVFGISTICIFRVFLASHTCIDICTHEVVDGTFMYLMIC